MKATHCLLALYLLPGLAIAGCATPDDPGRSAMMADSSAAAAAGIAQAGEPADAAAQTPPRDAPGDAPVDDAPVDAEAMYRLLVAEFAGRRGQLPLALENYLDVARRTGDPDVAERAVRIAVYARDQDGAIEAARLWVASARPDYEARQVLGALLVRAEQLPEAKEVLTVLASERAEADPQVFDRIANTLSRERSRTASVEVMEAVVAAHSEHVVAQFAYAQLLGRFGEFDKAIGVTQRLRGLDPDDEQVAVFEAQVLKRQNRDAEAVERLGAFVRDHPEADTARLTYARLLVDAKRYEDAREEFRLLAESAPDNADITYALGLLLLQTNDLAAAEEQFRKLVDVPDRRPTAWYYIGQIQESQNRREEALESYRHVDRGEHQLNAQVRAAVLMAEGGDLAAARRHLHGLRGRNRQESVRVFRAEAEILTRAEELETAMTVYDEALEEFPKDTDLLYARAMLAARLDRIEQVERDLRDILEREPDNGDALNALGYTLADRTERYEEAYEYIKRAYELKPDDHYVVDSLGWVLYRLGRLDEAIRHLRRAMELRPDPEVAAHLGEVLWVAGDRDGAKEVWNAALAAQPEDKRLRDVMQRFGL